MAQRKITPKPLTPKPMHLDAAVHVINEPPAAEDPSRVPFVLEVLTAVSFVPAAFEPRTLVVTAALALASAIRKAR